MTDRNGSYTGCTAPELLLKIVLAGTLSHYETRGLIDGERLEHMLHAGKQILYKSHQESDVRYVLERCIEDIVRTVPRRALVTTTTTTTTTFSLVKFMSKATDKASL